MVASDFSLFTTILSILFFSSVSSQSDDGCGTVSPPAAEEQQQSPLTWPSLSPSPSSSQTDLSDPPIRLHEIGECPTSPKPTCSDSNCEGPDYNCPMQFQCEATTAFNMNDRDVTLMGCRCCPLPIFVWCPNYNCRAPTGTRQCISDELEGCACETDDDRREAFHRAERIQVEAIRAAGGVPEDWLAIADVEIDYDDPLDPDLLTPLWSATARPEVSTRLSRTVQEQERHGTREMVLPTLGFDQQQYRVTADARVDALASF